MADRNYGRGEKRELNAIERDRLERRRQTRRKSMITNIVVIVVIVAVLAGVIVLAATLLKSNTKAQGDPEPTLVTATIASDAPVPHETVPPASSQPSQQSSSSSQSGGIEGGQTVSQPDVQDPYGDDDSSSSQSSSSVTPGYSDNSGSALHYYAYGSTTEGWDYTYSYDPSMVVVTCNYNTDSDQYDFSITGLSEGYTTLTLYYDQDDNTTVPVTMTVYVDSDLNVSQVG